MQNLIEDHMNKRGTEVNENVIASPQLKVLLKDIEKMKIKNQNIRSFDRQVIEDSFNETEKLLENRMNDIKTAQNFMKFPEDMWSNKKFDKEQMEDELSDVQEEMSYEL